MKIVRGIALLLMVGAAAACGGDDGDGAEQVQTVTRDQQLLYTLQAGTEWIGAVGRDAQYRATSASARAYAATMAADHEGIGQALEQAQVQPVESGLGTELVQAAQSTRSALQGMSGAEYDLAFVESAIRLQQRLLSGIDRDLAVLQNPALRQLAEQARPTLEAHIRRGRQLLPEMRTAQANPAPSATPASSGGQGARTPGATPQRPPRTTPDTAATTRTPPRTPPDTSRTTTSPTLRNSASDTTAP